MYWTQYGFEKKSQERRWQNLKKYTKLRKHAIFGI